MKSEKIVCGFVNDDIRPTKQRLLLEGKEYTPGDIHSLVAEGEGNHPSAIWDLYLFLNEWFNDDPVITVHTSGSTGHLKNCLFAKIR